MPLQQCCCPHNDRKQHDNGRIESVSRIAMLSISDLTTRRQLLRMSVIVLFLGLTWVLSARAEPQCEPATKAELRSAGGIPNTTGGYSKEFFVRIDSPKRQACQAAEQRLIDRVLKDRPDICHKGEFLKESLFGKMQLQQAEEYQSLGGGYFFNEGCKAHNCLIKSFTVTDSTGAHGAVGMLDCDLSTTGQQLPVFPVWRRIVYLYSDFGALDTMPEPVQRKIRTWVQTEEAAENEQAGGGYKVTISMIEVK
jgi:hypothetical protein